MIDFFAGWVPLLLPSH